MCHLNSPGERDITFAMLKRLTSQTPGAGETAQRQANAAIGQPLASEGHSLRRTGYLLGMSDLLWIPQAGLISIALGAMLADLFGAGATSPQSASVSGQLLVIVAGLVCLAVLRMLLQNRALNGARRIARKIQSRARADILRVAVERSPAAVFPASGVFAAQITEQVDLLGPYYRNYVPQVMRLKLVPLAIVLVTVWFSWLAALILLICGPLIPVFMALIGMRAKAASAAQQEELTRLSGILLDRIRGLETLVLFGAAERTEDDIRSAGERFRLGTMRVLKIAFLSSTVLELFSALGIAFCAVYVGFSLLGDIEFGTWGAPLTYSGGLFVLLLAPEFFAPLRAYAAAYHDRAAGVAALEKLAALIEEIGPDSPQLPECISMENPAAVAVDGISSPPSIRFSDVTLSLAGRRVFRNMDLDVAPGETVFLTGPSGSGKTTLLDCLLGFHLPEEGEIRIDGKSARLVAGLLRRNVIWISQSPRLFHGSLKANLLKGVEDGAPVSEDDLWTALRLAGAEDLVRRLPHGLATPLGEDGFGLSVGEIRRVALARAAMHRKATLVLADEPTAGLDEDTAADVIRGLKTLTAGRTSLIASHDPAVLEMPGRTIDLAELTAGVREGATP
ncbi:thiol reductant ABC exporter subunit CydD [Roseibium marinum]|uniref:ATP-binding cassette subfamily C protein CydD n=1 Tax=Roseibium marinum TaxID=281252 RepID=A0A2S3UNH7_9HYPH|nr:thiol reductant ABC exporter subunit CydD [Roseibium marinum]POF29049.1 ATP-binding cassette subfamily C protein CydD [Roseibium marinum]